MMTIPEAAAKLGVKRQWVWRLVKAGRLVGEQRGRDYFIAESEVDRYARERQPPHRPKDKNTQKNTNTTEREDTGSDIRH